MQNTQQHIQKQVFSEKCFKCDIYFMYFIYQPIISSLSASRISTFLLSILSNIDID